MGSDPGRSSDAADPFDELLREAARVSDASPVESGHHALLPGTRVGPYVVESPLAAGGMGAVYIARDPQLDRRVALKLVRTRRGDAAQKRMLREARALAAFSHPNIVTIYGAGEHDGEMYLAMELVEGCTLRERVSAASSSLDQRIEWLVHVARALAAAHDAGIIHRDVKPDNVMISQAGIVKVLDFGLARTERETKGSATTSTMTQPGAFLGTPGYASPEQLRGDEVDARTDQFSWAVMAHEVLTGTHPFRRKSAAAMVAAILAEPAPSIATQHPDVPREFAAAIDRALHKDPAERFATMSDLFEALPFDEPARSVPRSTRSAPAPRVPWLIALVLVSAAVVVAMFGGGDPPAPAKEVDGRSVQTTTSAPAEAHEPVTAPPSSSPRSDASASAEPATAATPSIAREPAVVPIATAAPPASVAARPAHCSDHDLAFAPNAEGILELKPECR